MRFDATPRRETRRVQGLELISCFPAGRARELPLLFVHGAFAGAWCWDELFLPYFARHGYAAHALSLRGHGDSPSREALTLAGIEDYVADVLLAAGALERAPVLVGHSMGGIVVQRAMRRRAVAAAVLMASVPPQGLAGSALLLAAQDPALFGEINRVQLMYPGHATLAGLRRAVFSPGVADADALRHLIRMQPESQRAMFDLAWPQHFWIGGAGEVPVMVMGAAHDAFFPPPMIEETARLYGVSAEILPDTAHAIMLEPRWRAAADGILRWLDARGL